ncbi:modification methylase [Bacillus sp. LL01]|nr:modification methylase [Bacillus sp. LL01]
MNKELPVIIDLFSGCGGLGFGFKSAGFEIAHGMDIWDSASRTASFNLYSAFGEEGKHDCGDITQLNPEVFSTSIGEKGCIVIGGPPCQAYSQIGKAKLRSLGGAHTSDSRGYLFKDFIRIGLELDARAIVMENVPEAVNYGGLNVPQFVCDTLEEKGYHAKWTILNAADYGVPQVRERVFVIAVKKSEADGIVLPFPTHKSPDNRLTPGQSRFKNFEQFPNFIYPNETSCDLPKWVTVEDALSDLPSLFPSYKSKYVLYEPLNYKPYETEIQNDYQQLMRTWNGYELKNVTNLGFRKTIRDFPIFDRMKPGDDYRAASIIAERLLEEACRALAINSNSDSEAYEKLRKSIVPPYDREKFFSKWKKLDPLKPSHTLVAHLSVDTYSHLHPCEPRGISVREAARLQSFPDAFKFQCPMSDAFKQIGNAVPPLLSKAIAEALSNVFTKTGVKL